MTVDEKRLNVRIPSDEHSAWKALSLKENITMSELIRRAMKDTIRTRPPVVETKRVVYKSVDPALLRDLNRIGNNLNQLARLANQRGDWPTLSQLAGIERELNALREVHQNDGETSQA